HPRHADELGQLGDEDQDGQSVDEANHDAAGNEPHQFGSAEEGKNDLKNAGQDDRGDKIVKPVLVGNRRDDKGNGAGSAGDHSRSSTQDGNRHGHDEGGEEPDAGVDSGNDG